MWQTLFSYENYCHDCIWPFWKIVIDIAILAAFIMGIGLLYYDVLKEELPKRKQTKVFGFTIAITIPWIENPRKTAAKWYSLLVIFTVVVACFKSVNQLIDDSYPDDYLVLDKAVKERGECVEGIIYKYSYQSLQGDPYSRVMFENGREFRHRSSDRNYFCYQNARVFSGIRALFPDEFYLDFKNGGEVGKVELRVCWAKNVNSSFPDEGDYKYSGICIYKIEAKLVDR